MIRLTKDHKDNIAHYANLYRDRLDKEFYGGEWDKERKKRINYYQKILSKQNIDNLSEKDFGEAVKQLWASLIWGNKDYLVNKIVGDNGIQKIRKSMKVLLYGKDPIKDRFDSFSKSIKGLGTSSVTEILSFVHPTKYGIWNDKPKNILPLLGMTDILPARVFKYQLSGKDYAQCNEVLSQIGSELIKLGFKDIDLLDVDIFMWFLFLEIVKKETKDEPPGKKDTPPPKKTFDIEPKKVSHWDAMAILIELGNMLGYVTYTADPSRKSDIIGKTLNEIALLKEIPPFTYKKLLDTVKNVDVIWFKDEFPAYCFEVEHTTGVTMGLLRLYQIRNFTNALFFVVAPSGIISRFQTEILKYMT